MKRRLDGRLTVRGGHSTVMELRKEGSGEEWLLTLTRTLVLRWDALVPSSQVHSASVPLIQCKGWGTPLTLAFEFKLDASAPVILVMNDSHVVFLRCKLHGLGNNINSTDYT